MSIEPEERVEEMREEWSLGEYSLPLSGAPHTGASAGTVRGVMLRMNGGRGVAQPWGALGQGSVESLRTEWEAETLDSPLWRGAVTAARLEADALRRGVSVWDGLETPESHYTWHSGLTEEENVALAQSWGCVRMKLKAGRDFTNRNRELIARLAAGDWELAVDFNGSLTADEVVPELRTLSKVAGDSLVWVEDPVPYEPALWTRLRQSTGIVLALDQDLHAGLDVRAADLLVVKPAVNDWRAFVHTGKPMVITSNMDHAVGQRFAACEAALAAADPRVRLFGTGLLTHHLYRDAECFAGFEVRDGALLPPAAPAW